MKTKYMMSWGLAFAERYDMKRLEQKAAQGWLLDGFAFMGYNLIQGPKQELSYSIDYQANPENDYFEIFKSAGWCHVTSAGNRIHVFSAPQGTPPMYSGNEIEEGKYQETTKTMGYGALFSFLALVLFSWITIWSKASYEVLFYPMIGLTFISYTAFVFCFMPYVAYKFKERKHHFNND